MKNILVFCACFFILSACSSEMSLQENELNGQTVVGDLSVEEVTNESIQEIENKISIDMHDIEEGDNLENDMIPTENTKTNIDDKQNKTLYEKKILVNKMLTQYYRAINNKEFQKAYDMKYQPNISFEKFKDLYTFNEKIEISSSYIDNVEGDTYNFVVDLIYSESHKFEKYNVSMNIIENKLNTLSSSKIESPYIVEELKEGDNTGYVSWDKGIYTLFVKNNGKKEKIYETIIGKNDDGTIRTYGIYKIDIDTFIGDGKFLIFDVFDGTYIYDVNNKIFAVKNASIDTIQLLQNDSYIYSCGFSGHGIGSVGLYDIEKHTIVSRDLNKYQVEISRYDCGEYNESSKSLQYDFGEKGKYDYSIDTGIMSLQK